MDPTPDRAAEVDRVADIRLDIELARERITETVDALEYKVDVPTRIADLLGGAASSITATPEALSSAPGLPYTVS